MVRIKRPWNHLISWKSDPQNVKDIADSIVIVLVIFFTFRLFVLENYLIPTGSMAPTLYGNHQSTRCRNCGYEYSYDVYQKPGQPPRLLSKSLCPNCRWSNPGNANKTAKRPLIDSGDRVLVMKLGYELSEIIPALRKTLGPQRWDVVVFKDPADPSINFIKRLVGMPGETLEIIDGNVFIDNAILRKTPTAQRALWFTVYDNDYLPGSGQGERDDSWEPLGWRTTEEDGGRLWNTADRVVTFDGYGKNLFGAIRYQGPIEDLYAYNDPSIKLEPEFVVSDLKLEFVLHVQQGAGIVDLALSKRDDVFMARIDIAGKAQLFRGLRSEYEAGEREFRLLLEQSIEPIEPTKPRVVSFENVDYGVRLSIDGKTVLETSDREYAPDLDALRSAGPESVFPVVEIGAKDFDGQLWHLKLMRDIYYRSVQLQIPQAGQLGHGVAGNPIHLGPNDYYVLGDNSPGSADSRLWFHVGPHLEEELRQGRYQMGTVPDDQMIGKAIFVSWPAWHRVLQTGPPIVPNIGEMRFVR